MNETNTEWNTFGHERVKNILNKQINSKQFPNAYLFTGAEGIGKKTLALEFAKIILNATNLSNHPDFVILDQVGEISVEVALNFISKLSFHPFIASKKVAIINNADNLNVNSSNALLKTLEEPSENTIIILIASNAKLLPTIISRCQVLKFNTFSSLELKKFAKSQNFNLEDSAIDLSFGKIANLVNFVLNKDLFASRKQIVENYINFSLKTLGEKILSVNEYAELETEELNNNLDVWLSWQVMNLQDNPKNYTKLQALTDSILGIKMNKNKKLILQSLFLKI